MPFCNFYFVSIFFILFFTFMTFVAYIKYNGNINKILWIENSQTLKLKEFHVSKNQEKRINQLQLFCLSKPKIDFLKFIRSRENKGHFYVSHEKKLLYCSVPKIASTNWKRVVLLLEGKVKSLTENAKDTIHTIPQTRLFSLISKGEVNHVLKNYLKFFITRHPFERLVSAYRNKFADNNTYFERLFGVPILRMHRANLTNTEYESGKGVTFNEFVHWLIERNVFDAHWAPVYSLCSPCIIPFNFIGKMETLVEDSEEILSLIGAKNIHFPANLTDGYKISSKKLMYDLFSTISGDTIQKLYKMYEADFVAFNYKIPEKLFYN
ncbi:carbohydrate sulfotransferase 11 isoform X3 [Hydra vulgaris]|uniref:Carbohydrate sulfotransferase n=1 Tax=Hydra vulgaris TaxID=6087 RepID=A0ABM4D4W7_HYDVU